MSLGPKKMAMSPKTLFSRFSQKMSFSSKKLLNEKIFETSFHLKKVVFILVARHPFLLKGTWPQK